jgi:FAD/FMN-containing dehydrogenase
MLLKDQIKGFLKGDVEDNIEVLEKYSHDASLLEVKPELVVFPKDKEDVENLVNFVNQNKEDYPSLSLTGRSAGTDMTGGPLNESIILDFTRYFKKESVDLETLSAVVEPGVYYRDFEVDTLPKHISLPVYPASKQLAALGGMIMNNAAGEKTLRYGQIRNFVEELKMVLADGKEYKFKKLNRNELEQKLAQNDFEGEVYNKIKELIANNQELILKSKPKTSKNSSGYAVWNVWNEKEDTFDLKELFVGSQGTLGLMTEAKVRLIKDTPHKKLIALFFKSWDDLPNVVNAVLPHGPESMEAFDDTTLKLGIRFMPEIAKRAHQSFFKFALNFLPETIIGIKMLGLPKLIVLVELAEETQEEVEVKAQLINNSLKKFPLHTRVIDDENEAEKYFIMRRESFNLLRQHVHGKRTAPFVEDFCIEPEKMPEFLPKLLKILKDHGIKANIAGHAGNGNYHIIPLMDMTKESERQKIVPVSDLVYKLISEYGGTITAEHNDGIIRTPYVEQMFGHKMYQIFVEIKKIFDPQNIFNPGKKVGGSLEYIEKHIANK